MKRTTVYSIALALTLALGASVRADQAATPDNTRNPAAKADAFTLISAQDLNSMIQTQKDLVHVYDANGNDTRKSDGIIPGATLLKSHNKYALSTLPKGKDAKENALLVFYCKNTKCMASHAAADRAVKAGFKHVNVMKDGIEGWKSAGYEVAKPAKL